MERDAEPPPTQEEAPYSIGIARFTEAVVTASVPAALVQAGTLVSLQRGPVPELLDALANRSLDIVLSRCEGMYERPEFIYLPIYKDRFVAVCGKTHPLWGKRNITLDTLAKQDWILPPRNSYAQKIFEQAFRSAGLAPPRPAVISSLGASDLGMMETQPLVALFPESEVFYLQQAGTLRALGDLNMQYEVIGAILLRNAPVHPATAAAVESLNTFARSLRPS
jgi:DNA-binding transcriptional LysR family regulator